MNDVSMRIKAAHGADAGFFQSTELMGNRLADTSFSDKAQAAAINVYSHSLTLPAKKRFQPV